LFNKMEKKVKCPKCNHEWETKSNLLYVTCPSCLRKIEREQETD